ncbi:hypothetical protein [Pseudopedobacter beijingensis]|uniref:Uncharacterized protein n=1 Tax=Pseudopedobacter beijingensis TaxID=1207056 RepID=A0ABW4IF91_9SPHI
MNASHVSAKSIQKLSATPFAIKDYARGLPVIAAKAKAEFKVNGCFCFGLIWCIAFGP